MRTRLTLATVRPINAESVFAMERGSTGNVIAGLASFFLPGLGQLVQGRILAAIFYLLLTGLLWVITFSLGGWIGHVIAAIDAAVWKGGNDSRAA